MNRNNVRVAVFSAGIVSGLLLLLYLPVLIWSPPWGEDGAYTEKKQGSLIFYITNGDDINTGILHPQNDVIGDVNVYSNSEFSISGERYSFNRKSGTNHLEIYYTENNTDPDIYNRLEKCSLAKTSNPFTLWHIKWLEWTADSP